MIKTLVNYYKADPESVRVVFLSQYLDAHNLDQEKLLRLIITKLKFFPQIAEIEEIIKENPSVKIIKKLPRAMGKNKPLSETKKNIRNLISGKGSNKADMEKTGTDIMFHKWLRYVQNNDSVFLKLKRKNNLIMEF